jgi:hypothetical protein
MPGRYSRECPPLKRYAVFCETHKAILLGHPEILLPVAMAAVAFTPVSPVLELMSVASTDERVTSELMMGASLVSQ